MSDLDAVDIPEIPETAETYSLIQQRLAVTPQGGVASFVLALLIAARDPDLGLNCITLATHQSQLYNGRLSKRSSQLILAQLQRQPYLPQSYVQGTTPAEGYTLPAPPYPVAVSSNPYSGNAASGTYKVFVACSGAASPRPVTLSRDTDGLWKAHEWSSLLVGIQQP